MAQADGSVKDLAESVDILTTIPNERLLKIAPRGTGMKQAFRLADEILRQAVEGLSEILLTPGLINLDFSDIRAAILGMGHALIGNASATGEDAAVEAARAAINSPLLEDTKIWGARQVLMNICASREIGLHEMSEACSLVREACGTGDTHVSFGVVEKPGMGEEVRVTVIATGFPPPAPPEREAVIEAVPTEDFFKPREPGDPLPAVPAAAAPVQEPLIAQPEPAMAAAGGGHTFDDELDVPAYLRQGKLLS
jgi:cell division protein FtsZ